MFCGTEAVGMEERVEDCKKIENYYYCASNLLGQGNFSEVFRGVDQNSGMPVAVKVIKYASLTNKVAKQLVLNETAILQQLNHPNVIRCRDIFQSKNNCYIITDLYDGGDLETIITKKTCLQEKEIRSLIYGIYKGLIYLNQQNIVHRDFKPANIFLDSNGIPKIADFGFALKSDRPFKDISIGSPIYMSPEGLILHEYGPKTEVWGFGIMIYEMLHGETPLSRCKTETELKEKVLLPVTFKESISLDLRQLIDLCLTVDPKQRIDLKSLETTAYMSKLFEEFEGKEKDLTSTNHTNSTQSRNALEFVKQVKAYEEGFALLHYCRLTHKTCEQTPSSILSQWLLNLCWNLDQVKLTGNKLLNDELLKAIHSYTIKYHREHLNNNIDVSCNDVIGECKAIISKIQQNHNSSISKIKHNNLVMLLRETELLQKFGECHKMHSYAKATQIEKYLESIKGSNKMG